MRSKPRPCRAAAIRTRAPVVLRPHLWRPKPTSKPTGSTPIRRVNAAGISAAVTIRRAALVTLCREWRSKLHGTAVDHPFWTIALVGLGLLTYKAVTKNESSENVKVSIPSFVAVGLMATAFILGEKWLFGIWQVPSVTPTMDFL